jgi:DNA invertase Pin-like site-specific DNA recombinase
MTSILTPTAAAPRRSRRRTAHPAAQQPVTAARCVAAIRGSTEGQRLTIPTQGAAIAKYCAAKGMEMVAAFIDSGTCGKTPWLERENVREMLRFMAEHRIQNVVYTRLDRAFRSTGDAALTINECANHGVKLHFCEQDFDLNSPMGRAMLYVVAIFAELETDLRLQRQLETVETMRSSNFKAGINVPYGWDKIPSANRKTTAPRAKHDLEIGSDTAFDLVPNWEEQDVLREILRRSEAPLMQSDSEIAKILNAAGIPAKKGGPWYPATVYSVRSYARLANREDWQQEAE